MKQYRSSARSAWVAVGGLELPACARPVASRPHRLPPSVVTGRRRPPQQPTRQHPQACGRQISRPAKLAGKTRHPAQQQALRPLARNWHELSEDHKRKWLEISKNYHALHPDEQAKLHSRMSEWVTLSQQQRTQARLNFGETKKLSPQEKAAKWEAYQALSAEEKTQAGGQGRPNRPAPPSVKPVTAPRN